jgi:hypothetical protein
LQACTPTEVGEGDTSFEAVQTVDNEEFVPNQNNDNLVSQPGFYWNPTFQALPHVLSPLLPAAPAVAPHSKSATASFYAAWFRQYSMQVSHAHVQAMEEVRSLNQLVENRMIRIRDDVLALPCFSRAPHDVLQVPTYSCLLNALAAEAEELSPSTSDPPDTISQGSSKPAMPAAAAVHKAFGAKGLHADDGTPVSTTIRRPAPAATSQPADERPLRAFSSMLADERKPLLPQGMKAALHTC